ncbi:MAG: hypothetical protein ACRYG7_15500 [Janthinobacterium lividum]
MAGLSRKISSAAPLETHCRIRQEHHARRVIIRAGTEMTAYGYDRTRDPLELLTTAQTHLTGLLPPPRNQSRPHRRPSLRRHV